jgi:Cu+-exporting ATPase
METHTDPVCGMQVNERDAYGPVQHDGHMYYFCSEDCQAKFEARPEHYIDAGKPIR